MRNPIRLAILLVAAAAAVTPVAADGNVNFTLGTRSLDEDTWEPVEDQAAFGVTVDFGPGTWPVSLAAGYYLSTEEDDTELGFLGEVEATAVIAELTFGVRKNWEVGGNTRLFAGAGAAAVIAGVEIDGPSGGFDDTDTSAGFYAQGGAYWRLGSRFNIGLDLRGLFGTDVELEDFIGALPVVVDGDADYFQAGIMLGWGWPAE